MIYYRSVGNYFASIFILSLSMWLAPVISLPFVAVMRYVQQKKLNYYLYQIMQRLTIINDLLSIFDIKTIIRNGGLLIVLLLVYGSTGLFFCFFIPTGAVLFATGLFAATGELHNDIYSICSLMIVASMFGCITGYWFGKRTGLLLYKREDSRFFKKQHLVTAESFYKKYGWMALTLGLYLPVIRTFVSTIAGIVKLDLKNFLLLTFLGSVLSTLSFILPGYFIGRVPALKSSLNYFIPGFILIVTIPLVIWMVKEFRKLKKANVGKKQE